MSRTKVFFFATVLLGAAALVAGIVVYRAIFVASVTGDRVTFTVAQGEGVSQLAQRLENEGVIRSSFAFKLYTRLKKIDRHIRAGSYVVSAPVTVTKVAGELLYAGGAEEKTITIIPGWDLYDTADYLKEQGFIESEEEFFDRAVGIPAHEYSLKKQLPLPLLEIDTWQMTMPELQGSLTTTMKLAVLRDKPWFVSLEGYLAPDTYRVYADATVQDVIIRLLQERDKQFTSEVYAAIEESKHTIHEVVTLASIVEREVRAVDDRRMVADIFWRRLKQGWALQADSTVHYAVGKEGDVFTTDADRAVDSPWNTYKYPGLPPGPISNPSVASIDAVIHPQANTYWYFLTDLEGTVHYAQTLDEHNANVFTYLR